MSIEEHVLSIVHSFSAQVQNTQQFIFVSECIYHHLKELWYMKLYTI